MNHKVMETFHPRLTTAKKNAQSLSLPFRFLKDTDCNFLPCSLLGPVSGASGSKWGRLNCRHRESSCCRCRHAKGGGETTF